MTTLTKTTIEHFSPSDEVYQHSIHTDVSYTAGIQFVAEEGNACWLIDDIASWLAEPHLYYPHRRDPRLAEKLIWQLSVYADGSGDLDALEDEPYGRFLSYSIDQANFPLDFLEVWALRNGTRWTLCLPSEV